MKRIKTDLDEVKDIRRKRYLKHNKEYNKRLREGNDIINCKNELRATSEYY